MRELPTISAIYTAAVKSLALQPWTTVYAGPAGIADDRRFHLIDGGGRLLTQRQRPQLARVDSRYDADSDCLTLTFPGGAEIAAAVELAEPVRTVIWGRPVAGNVVAGPWNEALSQLCGGPVRLVKTAAAGQSYDEYPLSLLSQASIDLLQNVAGAASGNAPTFDARRFRPNLLLAGCAPHDEDCWLGGVIAVGAKLRLRLTAPDPRCGRHRRRPGGRRPRFRYPAAAASLPPVGPRPLLRRLRRRRNPRRRIGGRCSGAIRSAARPLTPAAIFDFDAARSYTLARPRAH